MDICKVLEFRKILEPGACVLAMENCDEKTVAALEVYLEQMKEFKGDRAKFVRADLKFHELSAGPPAIRFWKRVFIKFFWNPERTMNK